MIHYFMTAFFFGMLLLFVMLSVLFAGMKLYYFDFYGIREFFNVIFADSMSILVLPAGTLLGYLVMISPWQRTFQLLYVAGLLLCSGTMVPSVGRGLGELFFLERNRTIVLDGRRELNGDVYYQGRAYLHIQEKGRNEVEAIEWERVSEGPR